MKISVITICFNSDATISKCLNSIKNQTFSSFEHIIIDGGSNDTTLSLINEAEVSDLIVSETDEGIYDAMNKGLKLANGEYVLYLNSDDWFSSKDVLNELSKELANANDPPILFCDVNIFDKNGLIIRKYHSSRWFKSWMIYIGIMPPHPGAVIKKDILNQFNGFNSSYKIAGDFDLIARLICKKTRYSLSSLVLTNVLIGGISSSGLKSFWILTKEITNSLRQLGFVMGWLNFLRLPFKFFVK